MRFFLLLSKMQFLICFIIFWAKANCAASDTTTLTAICTCGSETLNGCFTDEFCWSTGDSPSCNNHALCVPDDENAIATNNCQCASDSTTPECPIDQFCLVGNVCSTGNNYKNFSVFCFLNRKYSVFFLLSKVFCKKWVWMIYVFLHNSFNRSKIEIKI